MVVHKLASKYTNHSEMFIDLRKKILEKSFSFLNPMQLKAVFEINGPVVVLAGAGSGKTTAVINRIMNIINYGDSYINNNLDNMIITEEILNRLQKAYDEDLGAESVKDLICTNHVEPSEILAITFTNKAAGELKERLYSSIGEKSREIWACTFHSFCARVLRAHAEKLGFSNHFVVYDEEDSVKVIKECQKALELDDKLWSAKDIKRLISSQKDKLIDYKLCHEQWSNDIRLKNNPEIYDLPSVYENYQLKLNDADAMDFDDLILNTVKLFREFPEVLEYYQNKFKYILVDEYQDTDYAQYILIKYLSEKNKNICVVGDDDQSIYKFRGATIENIINFEKNFPGAKIIRFEQNYRSTKNILTAANSVISNNTQRKGKTLWTENESGTNIKVHTAYNEHDEANYMADVIKNKVESGEAKYSDFAILYRRNLQSNVIERVFIRKNIPYRIFGGVRFYDRKEVKDMLAYLSVINNPRDEVRLRRIINQPRRSIGDRTISQVQDISLRTGEDFLTIMRNSPNIESLKRVSPKLKGFTDLIDCLMHAHRVNKCSLRELYELLLNKTDYINYLRSERDAVETRIENVNELMSSIVKYEQDHKYDASLAGFLEEISLFSDIDNYDENSDAVTLMTLHASKGLEFRTVFLSGVEEGLFPSLKSLDSEDSLEEERRLAYVGITRCRKDLYILNSDSRMIAGVTSNNKASRFISEIPQELIEKTKSRDWKNLKEGETAPQSAYEIRTKSINSAHKFGGLNLNNITGGNTNAISFSVSDSVNHPTFGAGKIMSVKPMGSDAMLEIDFGDSIGTKKLLQKLSKLTKI